MPKYSTIGFSNQVVHIQATEPTYHVSDEDGYISIEGMAAGGFTLFLPGPLDQLENLPNDGDQYVVNDPDGLVTLANPLTVDGGGFAIENSPAPTGTLLSTTGFLRYEFTFNGQLKIWETCICAGLGGGVTFFARNSGIGATTGTAIPQTPAVVNVPWSAIESTGAGGASVPITPKQTGGVRIQGVILIQITGEIAADQINLFVLVDGSQVGASTSNIAVPNANGVATLALPYDVIASGLAVGVTHQVAVHLQTVNQSTTAITVLQGSTGAGFSIVDIQELSKATG